MLMPAAVLVVFLLGTIALDSVARFQAQRDAVADAQLAADDAASALSAASLRRGSPATGPVGAVDPAEVDRRLADDVAVHHLTGTVRWHVDGDVVTVTIERDVPALLGGAVPGARRRHRVSATASAVLVRE